MRSCKKELMVSIGVILAVKFILLTYAYTLDSAALIFILFGGSKGQCCQAQGRQPGTEPHCAECNLKPELKTTRTQEEKKKQGGKMGGSRQYLSGWGGWGVLEFLGVKANFDVLAITTACVRATRPNCCESLAGLFLLQFSFPFQGAGVLLLVREAAIPTKAYTAAVGSLGWFLIACPQRATPAVDQILGTQLKEQGFPMDSGNFNAPPQANGFSRRLKHHRSNRGIQPCAKNLYYFATLYPPPRIYPLSHISQSPCQTPVP